MKTTLSVFAVVVLIVGLASCAASSHSEMNRASEIHQKTVPDRIPRTRAYDPVVLALPKARSLPELETTALHDFHEGEIDLYLKELEKRDQAPLARLLHLARKSLGQPYEIFCLGEFPYETYDPDPLYRLDRSDCVTFTENMYAMALSADWKSFIVRLMKIRYENGKIGVASRNHYTEADWNLNNAWLFEDITAKLGAKTVAYRMKVDRAANLKKQFNVVTDIPVQIHEDQFIPSEALPAAYPQLQEGDVVEVVRGKGEGRWVGHVGLFVRDKAGRPRFLHSSAPKVREESLPGYIKRMKGRVHGLKFLRMRPKLR